MNSTQAFALLEIAPGCSSEEIRKAWRVKSTIYHPDAGGSNDAMVSLNLALEIALEWSPIADVNEVVTSKFGSDSAMAFRVRREMSSFTVNVLPVDCWMALEVVAALCGPTIQDEPPYMLEFLLHDSSLSHSRNGWCRCECVPEAGATTVHLTVGTTHSAEIPNVEEVRDFLVEQLNNIDWPD